MELEKALHQISEIHGHLARSEVYRGCRSLPVAVSGVIALAAAWAQSALLVPQSDVAFVQYWVLVAALCGTLSSSEVVFAYFFRSDPVFRNRTRRVLGQFAPCLIAGAAVTVCLTRFGSDALSLTPGLWAILFSLGLFAARPYLPRAIGWVGLFYLLAGAALLITASTWRLSPWGMGLTFGTGQLLTALVLYWNIERNENA